MSAVVSLDLARAIAAHTAAATCLQRAEAASDDAAVDRIAGRELDAFHALVAALPGVASPGDVSAVVEHAREQGGRDAAEEVALLRGLATGLSGRLFNPAA